MLKKENRLTKEKDFRAAMGRGRFVATPLFLLKYIPSSGARQRYGFVVSAKVSKKAPVRNTIKRRMRAIAREEESVRDKKGYDWVFIVKKDIVGRSFREIKKTMHEAMNRVVSPRQ